MKMLIQRVNNASVTVDEQKISEIGKGLLVLVGIESEDNEAVVDRLTRKLVGLRIFADGEGKTNLSLSDVGGELLMVSQFTLCADCKKGFRPSFTGAAAPDKALHLFDRAVDFCRKSNVRVFTGEFGADMKVSLLNDGPFTVILDSRDI
ncbi:MAG: D-tyrosyl-tRNA(Tyr) deacylase [Clostridia bacterium]|nr:D-tyrosyl-tRNA(Tyr) deacylase [Clostridia bacterium]